MAAAKTNAHLDASIQAVASWHQSVSQLRVDQQRKAILGLLRGCPPRDKTIVLGGCAADVPSLAHIVERVCKNRLSPHAGDGTAHVAGGVLVFYEPQLTVRCNRACVASEGLFDATDAPSWIYWLGNTIVTRTSIVASSKPDAHARGVLAWFPGTSALKIRAAIAAQCGKALEMVERAQVVSLAAPNVHDAPQA